MKSWRIVPFALHADSGPQSEASSSQANVSIDVEVSVRVFMKCNSRYRLCGSPHVVLQRIRNRFTTAWDDDHEPDDEDEKEEVEKKALKNAAENDALGSKHKAIYSGKSFMIKLVLDGSLLFGRAQTVLDGTAYGADAIGFGEEDALAKKGHSAISREDIANSLLESSAKSAAAAVAALSVPAQSDTIWCIIFTDGSGGPAKFGTCFYLQHLLTGAGLVHMTLLCYSYLP